MSTTLLLGLVALMGVCDSIVVDIVVPCYNEENRLPSEEYIVFLGENPDIHFTFVNDGSTDKTLELLQKVKADAPVNQVDVVNLEQNAGKAEATRQGMLQACNSKTDICGFWDGDLATPLYAIKQFLAVMEDKPHIEIVFGARVALLGRAIKRKASRHYLGRIFATLASAVLSLPIYDTQCGAKLFRVTDDLPVVLSRPFMSKWIFDVELLARYIGLRKGTSKSQIQDCLYEFPLDEWKDIAGSKLNLLSKVQGLSGLYMIWQEYISPWRSWPPAMEGRAEKEL
jgi:glycosyltransferase involved in cell wall biosynthesis